MYSKFKKCCNIFKKFDPVNYNNNNNNNNNINNNNIIEKLTYNNLYISLLASNDNNKNDVASLKKSIDYLTKKESVYFIDKYLSCLLDKCEEYLKNLKSDYFVYAIFHFLFCINDENLLSIISKNDNQKIESFILYFIKIRREEDFFFYKHIDYSIYFVKSTIRILSIFENLYKNLSVSMDLDINNNNNNNNSYLPATNGKQTHQVESN